MVNNDFKSKNYNEFITKLIEVELDLRNKITHNSQNPFKI